MGSTLRLVGQTAVVGGLARLLTILIPFAAVRVYGLGADLDAFFLAASAILFWTLSVAPVLETGVIARFSGSPDVRGWPIIWRIGVRFSAVAICVGGAATAILTVVPSSVIEPSLAARTRQLLLELSPLLVMSVWISLLAGWLNARYQFRIVALAPGLLGVTVLLSIYGLAPVLGVHALVMGYLMGETLRLVLLGGRILVHRQVNRTGGRAPNAARNAVQVPRLTMLTAQWLCLVLVGLIPLVDRVLAATLGIGQISVLEIVERLALIPVGVMTWAVLPIITAKLAGRHSAREKLDGTTQRVLLMVVAAGTLIAAILAAIHGWLFPALVAGRDTAWPTFGNHAFLLLIVGLPFHLAFLALWRIAVILDRPTQTFIRVGMTAFLVNLFGGVIAMNFWGLPGLTMATSLAFLCVSAMLWLDSQKYLSAHRLAIASRTN